VPPFPLWRHLARSKPPDDDRDDERPTTNKKLLDWVEEVAELTQPDSIHWCDGSAEEYDRMCQDLVEAGTFERLSDAKRPNSYLALSDPGDVARVEDRTFICSERVEDAGPTNNWQDPRRCARSSRRKFKGVMKGRTMYVVPFSMGRWAPRSPRSACS
jgi:phosphoenolpyruvate carboxykinase (GTP)